MTDEPRLTKVQSAVLTYWLLYGAIYITKDEHGNVTVHDPSTLTITPTHTVKGQ